MVSVSWARSRRGRRCAVAAGGRKDVETELVADAGIRMFGGCEVAEFAVGGFLFGNIASDNIEHGTGVINVICGQSRGDSGVHFGSSDDEVDRYE